MTANISLPAPTSLFFLLVTILITLILLFQSQSQSQSFTQPFSAETTTLLSHLRDSVTFLPLIDLRFSRSPTTGHTWFMSSINDTREPDTSEHVFLPSNSSNGRILCMSAHHRSDGTKNMYAFAYPNALPYGSTLLRGLTVVSDTHYDYDNIWHGLGAVVPVIAWHRSNKCVRPERWVLFHWGELRVEMGNWVRSVSEATIGDEVRIESFERHQNGPVCFEKAVVLRHNEGGLGKESRRRVYDMIRCKAREYCNVSTNAADASKIRLTLLLRVGARAFKNETAVIGVFENECRKTDGCVMKVTRPNNLTFCDQVKLMTESDILVSSHGAQLTNMIFMNKNSSVLEFFPKGWLELAGVGQYVFLWMADWSGMRHQGQWRDPEGEKCPYDNKADCFSFYKDQKVGHNETYFASWMARVLQEVKASRGSNQQEVEQSTCSCS